MHPEPHHLELDIELIDQHEPVTFWEWKASIFEFPENLAPCLMSFMCPCISLGRTMHRIGLKYYSDVATISFSIVMLNIIGVTVIARENRAIAAACSFFLSLIFGLYIFKNRELMRSRLGIQPNSPLDLIVSIGCQCCAITQMAYQAGITDFSFDPPFVATLPAPGSKSKFEAAPGTGLPTKVAGRAAVCSHPKLSAAVALNVGSRPSFCPDCGANQAAAAEGWGQAEPAMVVGATQLSTARPAPVQCPHLRMRKLMFCPDCGEKNTGVNAAAAATRTHHYQDPLAGGTRAVAAQGGVEKGAGEQGAPVCHHPGIYEAEAIRGGGRPAFCSDCGAGVAQAH